MKNEDLVICGNCAAEVEEDDLQNCSECDLECCDDCAPNGICDDCVFGTEEEPEELIDDEEED